VAGGGSLGDGDHDRDRLLLAALPHIPFDGWSSAALNAGARHLGLDKLDAQRIFPNGGSEAVEHFANWADRRMLAELAKRDLTSMPVRDRIAAGIRLRLEILAPHREALRRAVSHLALLQDAPLAVASTYQTVSAIWYAAGDNATDFNFYTKRGLLAGVYVSTVLYWLADDLEGYADTWGFLERRLDGILVIPKATAKIKGLLARTTRAFRDRTMRSR
jgi:ubiquinone biosynthesis protein COQ9